MDDTAKILLEINKQLGELSGKMSMALEKLVDHEGRLTKLESNGHHFKDDLLKLMAKTMLIAVASIASLTGAAGIIKQIFN